MTTVSIIVPCYNHGLFLQDALNSVRKILTPYPYEIIIINDGSTDEHTTKVLNSLEEEGYQILHQQNQGLAAARNNAISIAKGKFIIPLDSDNKLHKNYLTKAVEILEDKPEVDVVYGNPVFFGDEEGVKSIGEFSISKILACNYIDACSVFRKKLWEKLGGYDGNMPAMGNEDWEFWIHAFFKGAKFIYLNELCFYYRVLATSMTMTTTRPGGIMNTEYIYKKHALPIIHQLVRDLNNHMLLSDYLKKYRYRAAFKLAAGYKNLNDTVQLS